MYSIKTYIDSNIIFAILIVLVAILGDYLVLISNINIIRAIADNTTHAFIGGLTWLIVALKIKSGIYFNIFTEVLLATLVASLIDLDHFLKAKSLKLQAAISIEGRPPFHCTSIILALCLFISLVWLQSYRYMWLIVASTMSHHTRDAVRRGYWICPFGSTPPLTYPLYLFLIAAIPYIVIFGLKYTSELVQQFSFTVNIENV